MKRTLTVALGASLLLNAVLLLRAEPSSIEREPASVPVPAPPAAETEEEPGETSSVVPLSFPESVPVEVPLPDRPPTKSVRRPPGVSLSATPGVPAAGDPIEVSWTVHAGRRSPKDWIGLFPAGGNRQSYLQWRYVTGESGTLTFKAPGQAGGFEFRYVLDDETTVVATSNPVTSTGPAFAAPVHVVLTTHLNAVSAGSEIPIDWTALGGRPRSTDWIGLYKQGEPDNRRYLAWKYVSTNERGTLTLQAPGEPGAYEVRFLPDNGYDAVTSSPPFVVVPR